MADRGDLYVIAAPSGAGKTTLVKALVDNLSLLTVSISHTTRAKRPDEIDGLHYHFTSREAFEKMVQDGDFLEHATIFDNWYGTSKSSVMQTLGQGIDVILEIDWQGHQQIKQLFPHAISIFILPPSLVDLRLRLEKRNQDSQDTIEKRLADAKATISHLHEFDYLIVNDHFEHALHDLACIIETGRLAQKRQCSKLHSMLEDFGVN